MQTRNLILIKTPKEKQKLKEHKKDINDKLRSQFNTKRVKGNKQFSLISKM